MAVPKKRSSITRRRWRRSHDAQNVNHLSIFVDKSTGQLRRNHCANFDENGNLVYNNKILLEAKQKVEKSESSN